MTRHNETTSESDSAPTNEVAYLMIGQSRVALVMFLYCRPPWGTVPDVGLPAWIEITTPDGRNARLDSLKLIPSLFAVESVSKSVNDDPITWARFVQCMEGDVFCIIRDRHVPEYTHDFDVIDLREMSPWASEDYLYFLFTTVVQSFTFEIHACRMSIETMSLEAKSVAFSEELTSGKTKWTYTRDDIVALFETR